MKKESNKLKLSIELTFTEDAKITKKDKQEIIANVMEALRNQIDSGMGLAPEDPEKGDYITDVIEIKHTDGTKLKRDLSKLRNFNTF